LARIEAALEKLTGQAWTVRLVAAAGGPEAPASAPSAAAPAIPRSKRSRAEAIKQPLVARAMDLLGAQIVQVDEGFGAAPDATAAERSAEPAAAEED
jgi:hypothetical protein